MNAKGTKDLHENPYKLRFKEKHSDLIDAMAAFEDIPPAVLLRRIIVRHLEEMHSGEDLSSNRARY